MSKDSINYFKPAIQVGLLGFKSDCSCHLGGGGLGTQPT
jgi:hypothetical protein